MLKINTVQLCKIKSNGNGLRRIGSFCLRKYKNRNVLLQLGSNGLSNGDWYSLLQFPVTLDSDLKIMFVYSRNYLDIKSIDRQQITKIIVVSCASSLRYLIHTPRQKLKREFFNINKTHRITSFLTQAF